MRAKLLAKTLIIAAAIATSSAYGQDSSPANRQKAEVSYKTGVSHFDARHYDAAINSFIEAIKLNPTDSGYARLGFSYLKKGDDQFALWALNKAIDLNAKYAWALGLRGYLYTKIDAPELAYNDFVKSMELNSKEGQTGNQVAVHLSKQRQPLNDSSLATEINPEDEQVKEMYSTGGATFSSPEELYELTINDYTKVIGLYPENAAAYRDRGSLYTRLHQWEPAMADFNKAIELDSNEAQNYASRGFAYYLKGEYELAIKDYTQAIALSPGSAVAYRDRGNLYSHINKQEPAIADLTKAIKLDPKTAESYTIRGVAYALKKEYAPAIKDFTKSIELNPENITAYTYRAAAYKYQKKYKAAIKDYTSAIALNPQDAGTYLKRGKIYQQSGETKLAAADLKKAKELETQTK